MFLDLLIACCIFSNACSASSTSDHLMRGFDATKVAASTNAFGKSLAISSTLHQKYGPPSQIIAAANLSDQKVKRSTHNLYRLVGKLCSVLQHISRNLRKTLGLLKEKKAQEIIEIEGQSVFSNRGHGYQNETQQHLGSINIFQAKKFLKAQQNQFRPQIPSFSGILSKMRDNSSNHTNSKNHYNLFSRRIQNKNNLLQPAFILPSTWGGCVVTEKEKNSLRLLNEKRLKTEYSNCISPWLKNAVACDFLRFLRVKNGDVEEAWKMIYAHAKWRTTKYGADTILRSHQFDGSVLHRELFWLGLNAEGNPTLVIRTQAHDGADYHEDPKIFTRCVYLSVFMCEFLCVCLYVCMYGWMYLCMHAGKYVCIYACMYICMMYGMHTYQCMHAFMHMCMYACIYMYLCMILSMYMCMHVCIHLFI